MPHIAKPHIDPPRFGPGLNAHKLVAETAIEIANEHFEALMHSNEWNNFLRAGNNVSEAAARRFFALRVAPYFYEDARRHLADLLAEPDARIPPAMKAEIHEALVLDNALRSKRKPANAVLS